MRVVSAVVAVRTGLCALAVLLGFWSGRENPIVPQWVQLSEALLIAAVGAALLWSGRTNRASWLFGAFLMEVAGALMFPYLDGSAALPAAIAMVLAMRTDAFQAALLWHFADEFPRPVQRRWNVIAFDVGATVTTALGLALVALDFHAKHGADQQGALGVMARALQHDPAGGSDWYFGLQFLSLVPLLLLAPLKWRHYSAEDRARVQWFAIGIGSALLPVVFDTLLGTLLPSYSEPFGPYWSLRGAIITVGLSALPLITAYAVWVRRTLEVRQVARAALRYLLARWVVAVILAVPVLAIGSLLVANRDQSLTQIALGPTGLWLGVLVVSGGMLLLARRWLLHQIDESFFRGEIDARKALLGFVESARGVREVHELVTLVEDSITRAFHPSLLETAIADSSGDLQPVTAGRAPLSVASALAQVVAGDSRPLRIDPDEPAFFARLPAADRAWVHQTGARLIVPFRGLRGDLLGVAALGPKLSEQAYTADDLTLLAAVGTACGLALDQMIGARAEAPAPGSTPFGGLARECVECAAVLDGDALACRCGGLLQRAAVPYEIPGRLRFRQRLGTGAMGVVYKAVDLQLGQTRAVKTLTRLEPVMVARLRREARAMAKVSHPHLATLYGIETHDAMPMLVMECLDGGTLAERVAGGPMPVDQVLDLGAALGEALAALHENGILHRDIKPSNIGFTVDGRPKLLDFGLAKMLPTAADPLAAEVGSTWSLSTSLGGVRGTPAYLSPALVSGQPATPADDCWALSVTLLEACTGVNPFKAPTIAATVGRVLADGGRAPAVAQGLPERPRRLFDQLMGAAGRPTSARAFVVLVNQARQQQEEST